LKESNKDEYYFLVSVAPKDPEERKKWAKAMTRLQIALWVYDGGAKCAYCGHKYESVDDFLERRPRKGYGKTWDDMFVCDKCWDAYAKKHNKR